MAKIKMENKRQKVQTAYYMELLPHFFLAVVDLENTLNFGTPLSRPLIFGSILEIPIKVLENALH